MLGYFLISFCLILLLMIVGAQLILPFLKAVFIWYVIESLSSYIQTVGKFYNKRYSRIVGTFLAILLVIVGVYIVIRVGFVNNIELFMQNSDHYNQLFIDRIENFFMQLNLDPSIIHEYLNSHMNPISAFSKYLFSFATSSIAEMFLILFMVTFLTLESRVIGTKIKAIKGHYKKTNISNILTKISASMKVYLIGKTYISLTVALVSYIIMLFFGLQFASMFAIILFVFNYIPFIGSIIAVVLPLLWSVIQFENWHLWLALGTSLGVVQILIGNILDPKILGRTLNLSPLAILLGLSFFGAVWGIWGMFFSVPILMLTTYIFAETKSMRWIAILLSEKGEILTVNKSIEDIKDIHNNKN
ncbi:MAG: AI-2E family transporter [Alphaproteobacteria bacterium]|nr:AI-2E family transporter [Alphaproteobacteria bacterium]